MFTLRNFNLCLIVLCFTSCMAKKESDCSSLIVTGAWKSDLIQTRLIGDFEIELQFKKDGTYHSMAKFIGTNGEIVREKGSGQYFLDETCNVKLVQKSGLKFADGVVDPKKKTISLEFEEDLKKVVFRLSS